MVRAEGVEYKASTICSGLNQVLLPLSGGLDVLSPAHRDALAVVLGMAGGDLADRSRVAHAALNLVRSAGTERPLLLVVDDLQWLRTDTAPTSSAMWCDGWPAAGSDSSARPGPDPPVRSSRPDCPGLTWGRFSDAAAGALLRSRSGAAATGTDQVARRGGRRPPGAVRAPARLEQLAGRHLAVPAALLPLSDRLQAIFPARVTGLPQATQELLLLAVLFGAGDIAILDGATGGHLLADLAPAERAGLVHADDRTRQLVFRHSLTRSAVVGLSTAAERRQAHRRLADALTAWPDRRAWHLAEAALGPNEEVAALLEESAHRIVLRGDPFSAAAALARAADLSADPEARGRRSPKRPGSAAR